MDDETFDPDEVTPVAAPDPEEAETWPEGTPEPPVDADVADWIEQQLDVPGSLDEQRE